MPKYKATYNFLKGKKETQWKQFETNDNFKVAIEEQQHKMKSKDTNNSSNKSKSKSKELNKYTASDSCDSNDMDDIDDSHNSYNSYNSYNFNNLNQTNISNNVNLNKATINLDLSAAPPSDQDSDNESDLTLSFFA